MQDHASCFLHGHLRCLPLLQCRTASGDQGEPHRLGEKVDIKKTEDEPEAKKAKSGEAMDVEEPDEDLAAALALSMEDDSAVKHRELLESCGLDKDFQGPRCVEINHFTGVPDNSSRSRPRRWRGRAGSDGVAEPASSRHRAGVASMAWRSTKRFIGERDSLVDYAHRPLSCSPLSHTKEGRPDGGHYMGWVKREDGSWLVFDDDLVSESSREFVPG